MVSAKVLKRFGLFKGLDDTELAKIADLCEQYPLRESELVCAERARATHIYFLQRGTVDFAIRVGDPWNKDITVHEAHAGELFGWSALVPPYKHTGSATCVEAGEAIRIGGAKLLEMLDQNPHAGFLIMRNLAVAVRSWLIATRKRWTIEFLTGAARPGDASAWGEPGRR